MLPVTQIKALIRLLSDEDQRVAHTIAGKLAEIGDPAVPLLREAEIEQPEMAARISEILDDIRAQQLESEFHALSACEDDCLDLEATHHVHCGQTEDHREATKAFVEKREPAFKGR